MMPFPLFGFVLFCVGLLFRSSNREESYRRTQLLVPQLVWYHANVSSNAE